MTELERKIKYLVADTTAFINAVPLNEYAESVLTVPDVLQEIRHRRQIRRLCVLPYDLQVQEPKLESLKHCVEFAKKTGDYASLSGIDMKVIALTHELEVQHVGSNHLRLEPIISKVIASKDKPEEFQDDTKLPGWFNPHSDESDNESVEESDEDSSENRSDTIDHVKTSIELQLAGKTTTEAPETLDNEDELIDDILKDLQEKLKCDAMSADGDNSEDILQSVRTRSESEDNAQDEDQSDIEKNEGNNEDDEGWITPSNIKKVKKALEGKVEDAVVPLVACMSTDFAIQNVLKQMNLNICALDGRVIKHLRTYILRCYACFKTTSIMTKVFCPNCGNKTLKRVAVSLDENGKQVIHINTRRPLTNKYKNQALPRFRGGKHSHNPILFEDQPMPRQMPSRVAKTKTNALDEDYIAGFSPFVMRDVDSKSALLRSKGHVKEWARNTSYEEDRRKKSYNRLYK